MIGCKEIDSYIKGVKSGKIVSCENVKRLCNHIERCFAEEDLHVNKERLKSYLSVGELIYGGVYDWEQFLTALFLCTYKNGRPRWNRALILLGRGNGKDGCMAMWSLGLTSRHNPIREYDVDICANNEEQSTRPVKDVVDFLERPEYAEKNKKSYHWTLEGVRGLINKGRIRGHTNSPKGKDGLRSGIVMLNEIHQYNDWANINVFTTGLGKKPEPRLCMFTTNGDVRDGVLDHYLDDAKRVLIDGDDDNGYLFFLCSLDDKEEVHEEKNWHKANPSLKYKPELLDEMRDEYRAWKENPSTLPAFMTKRMNMPEMDRERAVVDYEYIKRTNKELPNLIGRSCIVGVDLSRTTDMCSVSLLFRDGKMRYVINHNWICKSSRDWEKIKVKDQFPEWEKAGLLTIVDDIEINPQLIADYIQKMKEKYNITKVAIDDFRYSIFTYDLAKIGFSKENKNLKLVRPSDIAKAVPVIESVFINEQFLWGNNPLLRWCTNNTKVVPWHVRSTEDSELGNFVYAKIDRFARKTDAFMSLVAAMTCDIEIPEVITFDTDLLRAVIG